MKVKISKCDLENFTLENIEVDPFWADLYNAPIKKKKRK